MPGTAPPADPRPPSALAVLGALLDRSLVQIEDATADARFYDREAVRATADVWDDNARALFVSALGRTRRARDRRARRALEWMADLGPGRRAWMAASAAEAGYDLGPLLPPLRESSDGPAAVPLTCGVAEGLAAAHRLDAATVSTLSVERRGTRLTARVALTAERARRDPREADRERDAAGEGGEDDGPVELVVHLPEVDEVRFDTRAAPGARLSCDRSGVAVSFGDGVLRGPGATLEVRDASTGLHLPTAPQDRPSPPGPARRRDRDPVPLTDEIHGPAARAACHLLIWTMVRIRSSVGHPARSGTPVSALCRALAGAGTEIAAAGAHLTRGRRERAFRELVLSWIRRGGPETAAHFDLALDRVSRAPGTDPPEEARRLSRELRGQGGAAAPQAFPEAADVPSAAALRLVSYTAGRPGEGGTPPSDATVHLAVPADPADPGAPWLLRILTARTPDRVRVSTPAFRGTLRPRTIDDHDGRTTLVAADGALEVRGRWS